MADFPSGTLAYGQTGLHRTSNLCVTTLSAGINNTVTSIPITSASTKVAWADNNFFAHIYHLEANGSKTGDELVFVSVRTGTTLSPCVRGLGGTTAVSHASGDIIEIVESSELIQVLASHMKGIEDWAGTGFGTTTNEIPYMLHGSTTNATQTEITIDGAAGGAGNRINTASNASYTVEAIITACTTDASPAGGSWVLCGSVTNNAGTLAINGLPEVSIKFRTVEAWDVDMAVSTSYLKIMVTGNVGTTIKWSARVRMCRIDK